MKRILVADDEIDIAKSIQEMLRPYYKVAVATTGFEILQLCENETFDALIIDVDFGPGISGIEVVSIIRQNDKVIKILIFSAVDYSDTVRQQAIDLGATFCEKPLGMKSILYAIEGKDYVE